MVWTILKWVGIAMILSLIALWLWQGGYWKIADYLHTLSNPLSTSLNGRSFRLPWQPEIIWEVPDTVAPANDQSYMNEYQYSNESLSPSYRTDLGVSPSDRSPYAGLVTLQRGAPYTTNPLDEYLILQNSAPSSAISISGWSLRSALTNERVVVPFGASPFIQGVINSVHKIVLNPGSQAILATGPSPVGVSFQETICTGYLAQTQEFVPALANACARPSQLIPRTIENERRLGTECMDYIDRLPQCSYPLYLPATISQTCRAQLTATLTYTGCMQYYGSPTTLDTWRVYFASGRELWQDSRDVIHLLDENGKVVDIVNY